MRGTRTNALVIADGDLFRRQAHDLVNDTSSHSNGGYLSCIQTSGQRSRCFLLAHGAVFIHALATNVITLGDLLRSLQHVPVNLRLVFGKPVITHHVDVHFLLNTRNTFNATRYKNIGFTRNHALSGQRNSLQTRRAKAVDCQARHRDGATSTQCNLARNIGAGSAFWRRAANDHVINFTGINTGPGYGVLNRVATQCGAMRHVERALPAFCQRRTGGRNN